MDVRQLRLMAVLAYPDDEALGFGRELARLQGSELVRWTA